MTAPTFFHFHFSILNNITESVIKVVKTKWKTEKHNSSKVSANAIVGATMYVKQSDRSRRTGHIRFYFLKKLSDQLQSLIKAK